MCRSSPPVSLKVNRWQSPNPVRYMRTSTLGSVIVQASRAVNECKSLVRRNPEIGISADFRVKREGGAVGHAFFAVCALPDDVADRPVGAVQEHRRSAPQLNGFSVGGGC